MVKFHISPETGNAQQCHASVRGCPYGEQPHYATRGEATAAFEAIMKGEQALPADQEKRRQYARADQYDTLGYIADSNHLPELEHGATITSVDDLTDPMVVAGNDAAIARFVNWFTDTEESREYGDPVFSVIEHRPRGTRLGPVRTANTFESSGVTWVVDYAYADVDINHEWPYVNTVENWQAEMDRMSFLPEPVKRTEKADPRKATLPKVAPGEHNPLVERAKTTKRNTHRDGSFTQFLTVDSVHVAAIRYDVRSDGPHIHSLETRPEYRHQGYMKELLRQVAQENNVDRLWSSGSYTANGMNYTNHLTKPFHPDQAPSVKWTQYTEENPFSFIHDWITGTPK